jgi:fucose permease
MATAAETRVVNLAGLVQGVALVTFPAASTILTSPGDYGLSSSQYGAMFVPQVLAAVAASLLGAGLASRYGTKRIYLVGLAADLAAMVLLLGSLAVESDRSAAYAILLVATACLGAGFGLTVPSLNTLTASFHPERIDRAVLTLNALLGLGTVLAPVFVAIFVGLGFWWGLPLTVAAGLLAVLLASLPLPLRIAGHPSDEPARAHGFPARLWVFASFGVLYGICETMSGNWAQLDMTADVGASVTVAAYALTAFWGMVTIGRVVFAVIARSFPTPWTFRILPFVIAVACFAIGRLQEGSTTAGVIVFGLAGLGCSALLPLTISFGQTQLAGIAASVAGGVIACYQVGYGIAALGGGWLQDAGVGLPTIFGWTGVIALLMGFISFSIAGRRWSGMRSRPT